MIDEDKRATLIAEHYRDSCKSLSKQLANRNKELVWLFALFALTMLNAYYPDLFSLLGSKWLDLKPAASPAPLPTGFAGFILLFAVMLLVGDIYNLSAAIGQTVDYLVGLESTLASLVGEGIIVRFQKTRWSRPKLLIQAALAFSLSFALIVSALTAAILWGSFHTTTTPAGWWFFILDLLLGASILYMSILFIRASTRSSKKAGDDHRTPSQAKVQPGH